jgi:hypothetical protein
MVYKAQAMSAGTQPALMHSLPQPITPVREGSPCRRRKNGKAYEEPISIKILITVTGRSIPDVSHPDFSLPVG